MLQTLHPLSVKGSLLLAKMLIYCGDIAESFSDAPDESCENYKKAETILGQQVRTQRNRKVNCINEP